MTIDRRPNQFRPTPNMQRTAAAKAAVARKLDDTVAETQENLEVWYARYQAAKDWAYQHFVTRKGQVETVRVN